MAAKHSIVRNPAAMLRESAARFISDDCLRMSAALSYYSAFSLAPLMLIAVAIAGAFLGEDAVRGALAETLSREIGPGSALIIQDMVAHARKPADNVLMSLAGGILLLIGAAGVFGQLQAALNTIWKADTPPVRGVRGFVRTYLVSFSMVLVSGFLLLVSMILTTALQALGNHLEHVAGFPIAGWIAGSGVLSFAVSTVLFAALFKILPNTPIRWRDVWVGAAFTTCLFMLGKFAIGWYLGRRRRLRVMVRQAPLW